MITAFAIHSLDILWAFAIFPRVYSSSRKPRPVKDLNLTRSPLTNPWTEITTMTTFEKVAATKRNPSQAATTELHM